MHPFIEIFGFKLPVYGLLMAAAMLASIGISVLRAKKRGLSVDRLLSIALAAIVAGIIGAKALFFIVTYSWQEFWDGVRANGISFITDGGLVFYGGLIGGALGAFLGAKFVKTKLYYYSDSVVPALPLAHAIGRLGCFFAGCCYGRVTTSWIGMEFPTSATGLAPGVKVIPTQLIECGVNLLVFAFLMWYARKERRGFMTLFVYLIIYSVERFLIEYLRGDEIRGIFGAFSTSQWISIGLAVLAVAGVVITVKLADKFPPPVSCETPFLILKDDEAPEAEEEPPETER